jgi:hypothetical protein
MGTITPAACALYAMDSVHPNVPAPQPNIIDPYLASRFTFSDTPARAYERVAPLQQLSDASVTMLGSLSPSLLPRLVPLRLLHMNPIVINRYVSLSLT